VFKVGDRVQSKGGYLEVNGVRRPTRSVLDAPAIVTKITERGFEYRYETPIFIQRPYYGTCEGGETYEPDRWELLEPKVINYEI
jgi:hypothetical protein